VIIVTVTVIYLWRRRRPRKRRIRRSGRPARPLYRRRLPRNHGDVTL